MATAINIYFQKCLFVSAEDFYSKQRTLSIQIRHQWPGRYDHELMRTVRVRTNLYNREYDFCLRNPVYQSLPTSLSHRRTRAIIDYMTDQNEEAHCEAIEFVDGRIEMIRAPDVRVIPYTDKTLEEYCEAARMKSEYFLNIFHYKRAQ
jgi:hypothetical protein